MPRHRLTTQVGLWLVWAAVSAGPAWAGEPTASAVTFSAKRVRIGDVLRVRCKVDGLKPGDWATLLVYPAGQTPRGPYAARSWPKVMRYRGRPGRTMDVDASIDLIAAGRPGVYAVYLYGWAPEFRIKLGEFEYVDQVAGAGLRPADKPDAAIVLLGFETTDAGQTRSYPRTPAGRLVVPVRSLHTRMAAVYQAANLSTRPVRATVIHFQCDAFWRGDESRQSVALAPGESTLVRFPLSDRRLRLLNALRQDKTVGQGRVRASLTADGRELAHLMHDVVMVWRFPGATPVAAATRPAPAASTKTDPVWGELTLVDAVDGARDEPDSRGAKSIRAKYSSEPLDLHGLDYLNFDYQRTYRDTTHDDGFTRVETILGRACRTADNWGWFAYVLGKGRIERGAHYLLEIDYPEDVGRTWCVSNNAPHGPGFHTGATLGDPWTRQRFMGRSDFALGQCWRTWRGLGRGSAKAGYRVSIHSMGDAAAPFSAGAAVGEVRLYKVETPIHALPAPPIHYPPDGLARRSLVHLQEDANPANKDYLRELMLYGFDTYAPIALHYSGKGTVAANKGQVRWASTLFDRERYNVEGPKRLEQCFADAAAVGMNLLPTFEYGGTSRLPAEAYAIEPDGARCRYFWGTTVVDGQRRRQRIDGWHCIDIAHPAVARDFGRILDELRPYFLRYPNIKGVELTHRFAAWQISFSGYELGRFAAETGTRVPAGSQPERARWVLANARDAYYTFFYAKKRDVLLAIRDKLRSIRPDLVLHVLNYVSDDHLPFGGILHFWTVEGRGDRDEFLHTPGQVCLPDFDDHVLNLPEHGVRLDLRRLLEDHGRPDINMPGIHPPLYRYDAGIAIWGPVRYAFTAGSPTYMDFFRTGEGLAIAKFDLYNEDCNHNDPKAWCPGLQATEHAGPFCVMEEVLAVAHADPVRLATRAGRLRRSFPEYTRAFAQAYLALPAAPSRVVARQDGVVVREIRTRKGVHYAVANTGLDLAGVTVDLRCFPKEAVLRDLVTGQRVAPADGVWRLRLGPVQLRSFRTEP